MVGFPNMEAYIYIYHLDLRFNLPVIPDSIQDSMPISFNTEPVLSRTAPQVTYSSAGPRTQQVTIKLHRQMFLLENRDINPQTGKIKITDPLTGKQIDVAAKDAADILIDALTTLSLPKFNDSTKAIVPPSVLIRFGNESCIRGVPSSFSKSSSGIWLKNGKLADVTLNFTITEVEPFSAQYTAAHGTLRGIRTELRKGISGMATLASPIRRKANGNTKALRGQSSVRFDPTRGPSLLLK